MTSLIHCNDVVEVDVIDAGVVSVDTKASSVVCRQKWRKKLVLGFFCSKKYFFLTPIWFEMTTAAATSANTQNDYDEAFFRLILLSSFKHPCQNNTCVI